MKTSKNSIIKNNTKLNKKSNLSNVSKKTKFSNTLNVSIVVPAYNEEQNVGLLYEKVKKVMEREKYNYEIIYIDDGSTDNTYKVLTKLNDKDKKVKIIKFRKNFGQTSAMDAGFKYAKGEIIIPMDADLQNDPEDIPRLIRKLNEGYDVVSGWRKKRKDSLFKHLVSRTANLLRKLLINDKIHDSGCTLKAYKKECFEDVNLYGEMHRFIPALLEWKGFKVTEIPVRHHSRKYGKTKYGFKRTIKGFLDMLVVKFWMQYSTRPVHLFGGLGILMSFLGVIIGIYLAIIKIIFNQSIANRPLLLLSVLLIILGVQFVIFGIVADIQIKSYYEEKRPYNIKEIIE